MTVMKHSFARKGPQRGLEEFNQSLANRFYNTPLWESSSLEKMRYVFGSTLPTIRQWGFPGGTLGNGVVRPYSQPTWDVFPYRINDTRRLSNIGTMTTTRKNGDHTTEVRETKVLQRTVAARLNISRNKGKWKKFSFPNTQIEDFHWLMPTDYLRSEGHIHITPGTGYFSGSNSTSSYTLKVNGYYDAITLESNRDRTDLRKHWSINGITTSKLRLGQVARQRAIAKIRRNDIELSVALAESRKTVQHLAKTAVDLFNVYRALKRGDFKTVSRILGFHSPSKRGYSKLQKIMRSTKPIAQRWLELQYAWQPLLGDVNGAITTILKPSRQTMSFKATGSIKEEFQYNTDYFRDEGNFETHVATGYTVAKCQVHYVVTDPAKVLVAEMGVNPALALWEVVPWSFVVDWFINIGDFLETIDVAIGKEFISGTETYFTELHRGSVFPVSKVRFPVVTKPLGGSCTADSYFMSHRRRAITTWPKVGAYIKNPLSTTHVLNAIALARTIKK